MNVITHSPGSDRWRGTVEAVTFDATGTLVHCPHLAEIYAEVFTRHGQPVGPERIRAVFPTVWDEFECRSNLRQDRFSAHPGGSRGWWSELVERVAALCELDTPSRFVQAELYDRFAKKEAWDVYPEVSEVLRQLRQKELRLAVISNSDERLPGILDELGIARWLDAVVYSGEVGVPKPHPSIFELALERLGVSASAALHVGDDVRKDVEGARAVGMRALHLDRRGEGEIETLEPLVDRLVA